MANEFVVRKGLTILTVPTGTTETDILLKDANGNVVTRTLASLGGVSGYSGKSGYSGISGDRGNTGASGYSGIYGKSGYSGLTGASGYSGAPSDPFWAYDAPGTYLYPNPANVAADSDIIILDGRLLTHGTTAADLDYTSIYKNRIVGYGKSGVGELDFYKIGAAGSYPDANTTLGFIKFTGQSPSNAGVEIYATTSEHNWSSTNTGAYFNIRTCPDNDIVIWSRFLVDSSGWVWINWDKAATKFTVRGDTTDYLFSVDGINERVSIDADTTYCKFTVESPDGTGHPVMDLVQNDLDKGFIWYHGSASNDAANNISTFTGSAATVVGPKGAVPGVSDGWKYEGMVKIEVNSGQYWMPYYSFVLASD